MHVNLHENKWTVIIEDLDIKQATPEQINAIGQYIATNTLVVIRNQQLTVSDEVEVCSKFGNVERVTTEDRPKQVGIWVDGSDNKIVRVSGELDEHGKPGIFGHVSDLDWHCNASAMPDRMPIVWLYGIKGTAGSRTSWNNNILTYQSLQKDDPEFFNQIKNYKMVCGYEKGRYSEFSMNPEDRSINPHFNPSIIYTNIGGKTGFYCSPLQIFYFIDGDQTLSEEESKPILERLLAYITQEQFLYHHDWQDHDLVLSEQWLGIHKRWAFEGISSRVLHRMTCDFANIKF